MELVGNSSTSHIEDDGLAVCIGLIFECFFICLFTV